MTPGTEFTWSPHSAPVRKFGRVELTTNFYCKQTWRWRGSRITRISLHLANLCLCRFSIILALPNLNIQGKVSIAFFTFLIWFFLPFLLLLLLILQRVLKHFLTHFTAARFAFLLNQELTLETSSISLNLCLIVLFTYTVDLPFFIGTTQGESTINCGGVVDPNYFCFSQVMLLPYSPQEIFLCTVL